MFPNLSEKELDALREISNVGAGNAATALYQMTNRVITLEVPGVQFLPFQDVAGALGGEEQEVTGLLFHIYGYTRGNVLMVFDRASTDALLHVMLGEKTHPLDELGISALKEVGNILCSAYLNAISQILGVPLIPSIPGFSMDMAQAVVDLLLIELSEVTHHALVIQTDFCSRDQLFKGHFFLMPDPGSTQALVEAIAKIGE